MCIVVDTNCLHKVFASDDCDFLPVKKWIVHKSGKMIIGGTTYSNELQKASKYLPLLAELRRTNKLVSLDANKVDALEASLKLLEASRNFNDAHILAIVYESGCRVVCTEDKKSHPFLKSKELCPRGKTVPMIYSRKSHSTMLGQHNIVGKCV